LIIASINRIFHYWFLVFVLLFSTESVLGHVVIGGNISYEFKGTDSNSKDLIYEVYLNFDVVCGLFNDENFSLIVFDGLGNTVFDEFPTADLVESKEVEPTHYECADVDFDYCIENRIYKTSIQLSESNSSYFVVFQHCCRASNLFSTQIRELENIESATTSGITLFSEITVQSQNLNNSAPLFTQVKPNIVCVNEKTTIDFSVFDRDGDSLVYELVSPHNTTLNLGQVFPYDPPPYPSLLYKQGYSSTSPFGTSLITHLDFENGKLLIEPDKIGHYALGVKISEYRNGIKLSDNYNDVRIYVDSCNPSIVASLFNQPDEEHPTLTYCDTDSIKIYNGSSSSGLIDSILWSITVGDEEHLSDEWDGTFNIDTSGTFISTLIVGTETGCVDSIFFDVNINTKLEADFEFEYDTCISGPVLFHDKSDSGIELMEYDWQFSSVNIGSELSFIYEFDTPGEFEITLFIEDNFMCRDSITKKVLWVPAPKTPIVVPDFNIGCAPLTVTFDNLSEPINEEYIVSWMFGENLISDEISPTVEFVDPGVYSIDLSIISPIGCIVDTTFSEWIRVEPAVVASFIYDVGEQKSNNLNNFF